MVNPKFIQLIAKAFVLLFFVFGVGINYTYANSNDWLSEFNQEANNAGKYTARIVDAFGNFLSTKSSEFFTNLNNASNDLGDKIFTNPVKYVVSSIKNGTSNLADNFKTSTSELSLISNSNSEPQKIATNSDSNIAQVKGVETTIAADTTTPVNYLVATFNATNNDLIMYGLETELPTTSTTTIGDTTGTGTAGSTVVTKLPPLTEGTNHIGSVSQFGDWKLASNMGINIGDVNIINGIGTSAVNIQDGGNSITVDGTVVANPGLGTFYVDNAVGQSVDVVGTVNVLDGGGTLSIDSAQLPAAMGQQIMSASMPVAIASNQSGIPVTDNAGSLTVDGTVTANLGTITGVATETTLSAINTKLISGTDIGDVTINNPGDGGAVNIQDGGNSITVDGAVTANPGPGTFYVDNASSQSVDIADGGNIISVDDGAGSLTVDGTVLIGGNSALEGVYVRPSTSAVFPVSGTITANQGTTPWLIGDGGGVLTVDATNLDVRDLTSTDVVTVTGGVGQTADVKITLDSESVAVTGTFWQATQPVSGTVTAELSATDNAVLDQIELNTDPLLVVGGGTEATAQRVTIASDSTGVLSVDDSGGALTVDGTVTANQGTSPWVIGDGGGALTVDGTVAVASIAGGDNNIGNVDIVTLPAGNLGMQTMVASLSTVPASNITDATYIGDIKFGESLPVGANTIGKLGGDNSGVDIGDVTINNAAVAGVYIQPGTALTGGGTEAAALRVTVATDSTGLLSVDDNGGALSIDIGGTVPQLDNTDEIAVSLWGKVAAAGDTALLLDASGHIQADILTIAASTTIIGKTYLTDGTDDLQVYVEGTAYGANPKGIAAMGRYDTTFPAAAADDGPTVPFTDAYGVQAVTGFQPRSAYASNLQTGGAFGVADPRTQIIATPGAGLSLYITDITVSTSSAQTIGFYRNTAASTPVIGPFYFAANGGAVMNFTNPIKINTDQNFGWSGSVGANVSVTVNYYIAP